jgi:hypothetical protein
LFVAILNYEATDYFPKNNIEDFCIYEPVGENIVSFEYTQQTQEFIVPEGVYSLRVDAFGAAGFGHYDSAFGFDRRKPHFNPRAF